MPGQYWKPDNSIFVLISFELTLPRPFYRNIKILKTADHYLGKVQTTCYHFSFEVAHAYWLVNFLRARAQPELIFCSDFSWKWRKHYEFENCQILSPNIKSNRILDFLFLKGKKYYFIRLGKILDCSIHFLGIKSKMGRKRKYHTEAERKEVEALRKRTAM